MENYINELLNNINDENLKVEKLKNELFKLELEINRLKSFTPTRKPDLLFSCCTATPPTICSICAC